ncbi:hypothetical protein AVEN_194060-1 [Araneus ventricosus]|uniref:Uncharacterized protein n=1 Tax=Araneus ventricosus TaxID=182803 RepID=A0A4Y2DHU6_ARAVE|nr:hypothetical protein AVEN_194060-1 [Araneus ventricosus]
MKETYETLKHMLSSIEYSKHSWHICAESCKQATPSSVAFCASGTAGTEKALQQEGVAQATVSNTGYAVRMKETYETLKHMLSSIEYSKHSWHICAESCKQATPSSVAFCASGTAGTEKALQQEGVAQAAVSNTGCEE